MFVQDLGKDLFSSTGLGATWGEVWRYHHQKTTRGGLEASKGNHRDLEIEPAQGSKAKNWGGGKHHSPESGCSGTPLSLLTFCSWGPKKSG